MPHEKIISGDLDGSGVEGHRKKITGGEFPRREIEKEEPRPERSKEKDSGDPFFTGFGSAKPRGSTTPKRNSVIGGDSDIFDTGFGSATQHKREKMVHAGGSADIKRHNTTGTPERTLKSTSFAAEEVDELFESPEPSFTKEPESEKGKKGHRMAEDPFYTGFGYTDQRGKDSPADGGLFPDGDTLQDMPEKELVPERRRIEEPVDEEPELPEKIHIEASKTEDKPKKSSILTRDDDDLFS